MKNFVCASFLLAIYLNAASGTSMTISPPSITIGLASTTTPLTFECKPSSLSGKTIGQIPVMKISMQRGNSAEIGIVSISPGGSAIYTPDVLTDIRDRTEISGNIVSPGTGVSEQDILGGSYVKFTMNQTQVRCNDEAMFKCSITYIDSLFTTTIDENSENLTTKALPVSLTLTAIKVNTGFAPGGGNSADNKAEFNIGEVAKFTCTGDIGSDKTKQIKWQVSGMSAGTPWSARDEGVEDGVINSAPINCQYSLTSHMTYNISKIDATRPTDMRVQCFLTGTGAVQSNIYYINPYDPSKPPNGGGTGSSTGESASDAGIIAGSVIGVIVAIVIVALLVYFLWYRRRNEGDTYNTKEETGASNPNLNTDYTYSVPVKGTTRTGHENRGLDEPHEAKHESRHEPRGKYRDADDYDSETHRGRANYGMDGDDDYHSMDGGHGHGPGENINHMGVDPHSGSYGTGV